MQTQHVLDHADRTAPTRKHELDHADLPWSILGHRVGVDDLPDVWIVVIIVGCVGGWMWGWVRGSLFLRCANSRNLLWRCDWVALRLRGKASV